MWMMGLHDEYEELESRRESGDAICNGNFY